MAKKKSRPDLLCVEGEMSIRRAAELKRVLLQELESKGALKLDLSRVSELDCAGVQLLLLSERAAREQNKKMEIAACSEAVSETLNLLGLGGMLAGSNAVAA